MKDPGIPETAHWQARRDLADQVDDLRYKLLSAEAECERLRAALAECEHIAMSRRVGGPRMDGSETFASPAFKQIRDIARAALGETDDA